MTAWTPPPPGDRREQLPDEVLAAIRPGPYLSTACHAAFLCETTEPSEALAGWPERLHARCRLNNKFTGKPCVCSCHEQAEADVDDGPTVREAAADDRRWDAERAGE